MLVLGIETSCDETAAAIYDGRRGLLANEIYSQIKLHAPYGGVVPELASRDHSRYLEPVIQQALEKAQCDVNDIAAIAYTKGPGLVTALMVGASYAKALAMALDVPAIGVHHMEAHLLAAMLSSEPPTFPFVALLISGGHTQLMAVEKFGSYQLLGATLDDAIGEAFDKTAKLLGLPYPGGPSLEKLIDQGHPGAVTLPRPMLHHPTCDMSLSGLKTAVAQLIEKSELNDQFKADVALEFHCAIAEMLIKKTKRALDETGFRQVVIAGGVSANQFLRKRLDEAFAKKGVIVFYPPMAYCTDNAAMVAYTGFCYLEQGKQDVDLSIQPVARWPMDAL
jgi:N6-L-threonylcarbamoyladenine synthase